MEGLADRVADVRARIAAAAGRPVALVAVTKGMGPAAVTAARQAGLDDLGENYGQELLRKAPAAPSGTRWHFLGAVQRRKVRDLAPVVALWQSVDSLPGGLAIARHAPGARVLVQVNLTGDPRRRGCGFAEAPALVDELRHAGLDVAGLMGVGPPDDPRPGFRHLALLGRRLGLAELSMGMSGDYEAAVAEGSTMVRLGTALFGPRSAPADLRR